MSKKSQELRVEALEDRSVPAASLIGALWANPSAITVSFAPDQTDVAGAKSDLFSGLAADGYASAGVWQKEALRALQTWAAVTNLNFGVVADGGQALGTAGAVQGDARFGDIRFASRSMSGGSLAQTSFLSFNGNTWSGDIVLNSDAKFSSGGGDGYDLYSVVLQEAGHALGFITDSTDAGSVMNSNYAKQTGLGATDIAAIKSMYGGSRSDPSSSGDDDDDAPSAVTIGASQAYVRGDITKAGEVDTFKVQAKGVTTGSALVVNLQTNGISLLTGKVTVHDSNGKVVGTGTAADSLNGNVNITVLNPKKDATYTIKVQGGTTGAFGIGAYQISAKVQDPSAPPPPVAAPVVKPLSGLNSNTSYDQAVELKPAAYPAGSNYRSFAVSSNLSQNGETDYYKITVPSSGDDDDGGSVRSTMIVRVAGLDATALLGRLSVFTGDSSNRKAVAFQVLVNANGLLSIQIPNAIPGGRYTFAVSAQADSPAAKGNYRFSVDLVPPQANALQNFTGGTLTAADPVHTGTLTVTEPRLVTFSTLATGSPTTRVEMTIRDAQGKVVFTLTSAGGALPPTGEVFLNTGNYSVTYRAWDTAGSLSFSVGYRGFADVISDPIGMYLPPPPSTTTSTTMPPPPDTTTTSAILLPPPMAMAPPTTMPIDPLISYSTSVYVQPLVSYPFFF